MIVLLSSGNLHIQASEIRAPQADYFFITLKIPILLIVKYIINLEDYLSP